MPETPARRPSAAALLGGLPTWPARPRWSAALLWLAATWTAGMGLLLAAILLHAVAGPGRRGGGPAGVVAAAVYFGAYAGVHLACALAPVAPAMLAWAYGGPALGAVERRGLGVAAGAGVLAWPAAAVLGSWYADAAPAWARWLLLWALVLAPRVVVPSLRPGAFARPRAAA